MLCDLDKGNGNELFVSSKYGWTETIVYNSSIKALLKKQVLLEFDKTSSELNKFST